jgi:tRNA nucleotidyltransferase (CCA-adding enzyme)
MSRPASSEVGWELFPHDADTGVLGRGRTVAEAFEQAALALTAVVTSARVEAVARVVVACERRNIELLLVDWLDAVIYEMAVRKMLFGRYSVQIESGHLAGTLWGEPVDVERHAPACEPKGTTLTALAVTKEPSGLWSARCVIDV